MKDKKTISYLKDAFSNDKCLLLTHLPNIPPIVPPKPTNASLFNLILRKEVRRISIENLVDI